MMDAQIHNALSSPHQVKAMFRVGLATYSVEVKRSGGAVMRGIRHLRRVVEGQARLRMIVRMYFFHVPERVRVQQYGKSCKELTALYKSQEILAHYGAIWTIKCSLDEKYMASAGEDCIIYVWKVTESERKGDLLLDKPENGNLNLLILAIRSPQETIMSPNDSHPEKRRRGRLSISKKSGSFDMFWYRRLFSDFQKSPSLHFRGI